MSRTFRSLSDANPLPRLDFTLTRREAIRAAALAAVAVVAGSAALPMTGRALSASSASSDAQDGTVKGDSAASDGKSASGSADSSAADSARGEKGSASDVDRAALAQESNVEILGNTYSTLAEALEVANQNGGGTVTLHGDCVSSVEAGTFPTVGFRTSITIESDDDGPFTVYRGEGTADPLLVMTDGTVRVRNVTLDGSGDTVGCPLVIVSDQAVVTFGEGLTLQNNTSDGSSYPKKYDASAVAVMGEDAQLTLESGCVIRDNAGVGDEVQAALLANDATVTNNGATFEGNTVEATDTPNFAGDAKVKGEQISND